MSLRRIERTTGRKSRKARLKVEEDTGAFLSQPDLSLRPGNGWHDCLTVLLFRGDASGHNFHIDAQGNRIREGLTCGEEPIVIACACQLKRLLRQHKARYDEKNMDHRPARINHPEEWQLQG